MSHISKTASAAVVALVATVAMTAPSFASSKNGHHGKHDGLRMSQAGRPGALPTGRSVAAPAAAKTDGPFGPNNLFGGVNGNGVASGGAEDPANFRNAGLGGDGLLGTGLGGGDGLLGTGVLNGQGALGLGILGL